MHILAHRGVSAHYHENTILAFEKALEIGVYGIELDLHQIENEFVIFHDFQLDRLAKTRADIADVPLAKIAQIRLNEEHKLPLLSEVFALVKGATMLNLEIKYVSDPNLLVEKVAQYVEQYNASLVISSFNHPVLSRIMLIVKDKPYAKNIKFGALVGHLPITMAQYAVDLEVDIAAIDAELVSSEFVEHAHKNNLEVWAYTVNYEKGFRKLRDMGVDAVFSNDPALMAMHAE
jgi:glycerophosphoryl diester phosphodiesterase